MKESEPVVTDHKQDPLTGTYIEGRYRIESLLGKGGSAAVYKAFDEKVGRMVAIKLPKNAGAFAEESKESFEKEATRYIRLQHPNTLRLFDYGQTDSGQTFIVTELLEGETLTERLDRLKAQGQKGIGAKQTLMLLKDVASALSEAHAVGLVHRDLKPSNIFLQTLGGQEVIKVIDFGIAKDLQEATMTGTSSLWGTPLYMSPEQAHGRSVDARSDLYTLGVIGFECLTGQTPFSGSTPYAILMQHIDSTPPTLAEAGLKTSLPQGFEAMINRLMEKDPADRTKSSDALIAEIQVIEELWASFRMTGTSMDVQGVHTQNKPYAVGVLLALGLTLIGYFFMSPTEQAAPTSSITQETGVAKRVVTTASAPPKKTVAPQDGNKNTNSGNAETVAVASSVAVKNTVESEILSKKKTTIKLETRPSNALVTLDGKSLGHTPLDTVVSQSKKARKLTLKLSRYKTRVLSVAPGTAVISEVLRLKPLVTVKPKKKSPFKVKAQ